MNTEKKLTGKYGTSSKDEDEEKKKETKVDGSSVWDDSFESYRKKMNSRYGSDIDEEAVKSWFTESESTIKGLNDYYKANDGKWVSNYGSDFTDSLGKLSSSADAVAFYLRNNKSKFGDYATLSKALTEYRSYLEQAEKQNNSLREFYSQFGSEDEYNSWKRIEDERQAVLGAEDFDEYYQVGKADDDNNDLIMEIFGNPVGESNYIEHYRKVYADVPFKEGTYGGGQIGTNASYALAMTEDEVKIYDYYLGKYGKKRAEEYLDSIKETLNQRVASGIYETVKGNKLLETTFAFSAGLDQFVSGIGNLDNLIMGTGADPTSATQYASSMIREDMDGLWGVAYDLTQNTAHMLPSILVGSATGGLGGALTLGASAVGNGYAEMRNLGYDEWQSRGYGLLVGASEAALQYALGGISKLGGKVTGNAISKLVSKFDNAIARTAIKLGGNMASEGLEEAIQTVLEPAFKALVSGEDFESPEWEDVWYSALLGALSAGVLEGAPTIAGTAINSYQANKVYGSDPQALITESLDIDPENAHAQRMQARLDKGENVSGYQLNRLVEANEQTLRKQDTAKLKSAVEAKLNELGETGDISKLADVIVKEQSGEILTRSERKLLAESKYSREDISKWTENIETERINIKEYDKGLYDLASEKAGVAVDEGMSSVTKNTTSKDIATESDFEVSEDGKTRIGDTEVTIKEIASIKDGVVTLRLEDGSTVNASDVEYSSSEEGLLYENVVHMGLNATTANAFINGYEGNMPVAEYALDFRQAYRYGELGIPKSEMNSERFVSRLSASVKDLAYNLGAIDAKHKASEKQSSKAKIDSTVTINAEKNASKGKKKGRLYNTLKPTTELQRTSLKTLGVLAEALNMDIYTFESAKNAKGQHIGANGWYDLKDNSLHLDLYAGQDGRGTMLFTAAHELTHHIREKLPVKFKAFADFLFEQYGEKGVAVSELIARKIDHLEKNGRTKGLTESQIYDLAYEEVVADACETFLADGDAVAKIAELKAKDKTLWQTIKDFLAKLVARIKAAYEGLSPDSVEGKLVADMLDTAEKLKAMWVEMVVEASEVTALVEVDMDTESVAPMFSERTWTASEYVTEREETAKKISEALGVNLKTAYKYIDDINGVARLIADDRARLDYEPNLDEKATVLKPNSEYKFSVDMSTLCAKRLLFTGTFDAIQKALPNMVFESEDIVSLREMMQKRGYEVACGFCYVESTRREIGRITQEFIDRYKVAQQTGKPISRINSSGKEVILKSAGRTFSADKNYTPNLGELNTTDIDIVKRDHREVYDAYLAFMNARGQAKPKLLETRAEYKGEILTHFKAKSSVEARNNAGGLRLQSFSDFEVPHMIDMMQIVMDMSRVGLKSQAYTKVPAFAEIFGDSGVKINLSLVAKGDGLDANGNLIFDDVEGINHKEAFKLRDQYSKNVGTILVGKTDAHIIAAMADSRIDYIIPFHKSSWKESLYDALGLTGYADYTDFQNEKPIDKDRKIKNFDPSEYWDFSKSGDENAQIYLKKCREDGRIPKFPQFQGYPGYWKLLIDFKMYDNNGVGSPQEVVKPVFNTEASERILGEYKGGHKSFPVAKDVVEDFVKEHKDKVKYSDRDSEGNRLSNEQIEFFKDSKVRWGERLMPVYHGTRREFTMFDSSKGYDENRNGGLLWAAKDYEYAKDYSYLDEPIVMKGYLNITNLLDIGDIDTYSDYGTRLKEIADLVKLTPSELESLPNYDRVKYIYDITSSKGFRDRIVELGYDGVTAQESGLQTFGFANSNQFKDTTNKTPTSAPDIRYSDRDFASQVEATLNGADTNSTHLKLMETPALLQEAGLPNLPVLMTANHLKKIIAEKGHGLDVEVVKKLPEYISSPVMIADSLTRDDSIVIITEAIDSEQRPVVAAILLNGSGRLDGGHIKANIMTSAYGRNNFQSFLNRIVDSDSVIYWDEKKSQDLSVSLGLQLPNAITSLRSGVIIHQARAFVNTQNEKTLYSDRDSDSVSNRSLLANALESVAQNDIERNKLKEYKSKIALIESEQEKLADIRAEIKELSFAKGRRDTEALKKLQFEANQAANRINTYDRQLLNLESTKALKGVLEREKQMAYKKAMREGKEALTRQKEKAAKTQRELLTRYQESRKKGIEGRKKTEMRHKIKDVVNELNQYLTKGTKDKHVPIELQKAVAEALDAVNMDTVGAEERIAKKRVEMMAAKTPEAVEKLAKEIAHIEEMGGNMAKKISRLKTAYDSIINSDDPLIANSHDEVISNSIDKVIEDVGETPLRDMSLYQLEAVYDMYRMVLTSVRNANKAFKAQKSEEISVIANRVMDEIDSLGKKKLYRNKAEQFASKFDWNNLKPVYAFERIGSDTFTEVFNNVRAGEDTWAVDITEAKEFSTEQHKKYKYDSWDFKKRYRFASTSGMSFELSLDQIMSLYAYSKREQAKDHLKRGGIVFDETTEVTIKTKLGIPVKYNPTQATAYNLSEETLADIISKLTTEQREFVDVMQDYLSSTMGDKGNEVSLALYGVKLYKEKNYFPLKSATQFMAKAKEQQKGEVKIKNSGFSKETKPKASNPIVLTPFMDVWADHVNEMSMYHAFVLALEDFYRVFNYKTPTSDTMATESVEMYLQNAFGKAATQYIDQLLKDLNGGARVDSTVGVINKLTGIFKKSAVFASASVVVQQPSAIARATALVDTKYFVGKLTKHKETWAEVKKYAPVAIIKEMGYFDTGMGQSTVEWLKGEKTLGDKIDDVASKAPALADEYAWCAIWNAVKRETVHTQKNLRPNSEEFLKVVGERFTEVIVKTQVYDSVLARSANMRSKDTGMTMATAFMGEPTTSLNMLENALVQGKRGNKGYARKAIGSVVASMILNSILVSIVYAGRDDDEDKTYGEKYISTLTEELLDSLNPLTLIPFVKDIVSIVQGYDVERSDMAVITDIIKAWQNLDNDNRSAYRKVEDFAGAIAAILGLPVKNLMRDARAIYNTVNSFINGEKTTGAGIKNAVTEAITGDAKSNGQQLYEAMLNGDTEQIERLKGRFKDQSAINSAIRKALRENDPRIKEAAEASINGDTAKYSRIFNEILGEGNFELADIKAAIKSEIGELEPDDDSTSEDIDKAESMFELEHYYTALISGDLGAATKVKNDLIDTAVANGKTREDAEDSFKTSFRSYVGKMYKGGEISRSAASNMLVKYGGYDADEVDNEVYWKLKEWDFKIANGENASYSKYTDFYEAVKTGRNLKAVISEYTSHGVEAKTLATQITSYYKPLYKAMTTAERANIKGYLLNAYALLGYDRTKKARDIDKWLED